MRSQKHNRIQGQLGLKNSRWYEVEQVDCRNLLRSLHNDRFMKVDGKRISEMFLKILFPPAASFEEHAGILMDENRRTLWVLNKTRASIPRRCPNGLNEVHSLTTKGYVWKFYSTRDGERTSRQTFNIRECRVRQHIYELVYPNDDMSSDDTNWQPFENANHEDIVAALALLELVTL